MGATKGGTVLQALELDAAIIESLSEPVLYDLIGFIEYDNRLTRQDSELTRQESEPAESRARGAASYASAASWPGA